MTAALGPPRPRGGEGRKKPQVTVVFPDPVDLQRLDAVARRRRLSVSSLMRMWVMEHVEEEERVRQEVAS